MCDQNDALVGVSTEVRYNLVNDSYDLNPNSDRTP